MKQSKLESIYNVLNGGGKIETNNNDIKLINVFGKTVEYLTENDLQFLINNNLVTKQEGKK